MSDPVISFKNVSYGLSSSRVFATDINLLLYPGDMLVVHGPNGSGKSTLLKTILKKWPLQSGSIRYNIPEDKIALIPQMQNTDFHLPLSLLDVLSISQKKSLSIDKITEVGLLDPSHLSLGWNTASGGERKRTLLTRALMQECSLLLLDEPMNHLDQESRQRMRKAIGGFLSKATNEPRAVVMIAHEKVSEIDFIDPQNLKVLSFGESIHAPTD